MEVPAVFTRVATLAAVALAAALIPASAFADDSSAAVAELNRYRVVAGLDPVTLDAGSAAAKHAHYLALNAGKPETQALRVHTEVVGLPGYTPEGARVAVGSNVNEGEASSDAAVRALMDAPIHRHAMLAPGLDRMGAASEDKYWVLDVTRGTEDWRGTPRVVPFPAPGQRGVDLAFTAEEVPNPLAAVPGLALDASVGYPITLHFFGCDARDAQGSLSGPSGPVPVYLVQPGTTLRAEGGERTLQFVLLFPQTPLQPSTSYTASVTATCGALGPRSYTWSFTTRARVDPASSTLAVSPRGADGWQSVAVRLQDSDRQPVGGVRLATIRLSYVSRPGAKPTAKLVQTITGSDGVLRVQMNLGDAPNASVQMGVVADGERATIPVLVSPSGAGSLPAFASSPIPSDLSARAAFEASMSMPAFQPVVPDGDGLATESPGGDGGE